MVGNSYINFVNCAKTIPGFIVGQKEDVPYDITDLMMGYCKAKDENNQTKMNQYISALFVRYWHVVIMLYKQSTSTRLEFDDIVSWVYEAFEKAALYRSWLDTSKSVSKSPKGAEKCINQCITSVRQYWYKHFNQDKRKINFITSSLNENLPYSNSDDNSLTVLDTIEDPEESKMVNAGRDVVQHYLDKGKVFEAIVLDGILYHDCFIDSSSTEVVGVDEEGNNIEVIHYKSEFSGAKLKKHLRALKGSVVDNFVSQYDVNRQAVDDVVTSIDGYSKAQLSSRVDRAFKSFKCNKEIKDWLCL